MNNLFKRIRILRGFERSEIAEALKMKRTTYIMAEQTRHRYSAADIIALWKLAKNRISAEQFLYQLELEAKKRP